MGIAGIMGVIGFCLFVIGLCFIISYPINKRKNSRCTAQTQGELVSVIERENYEGPIADLHVYSYRVNGIEYQLKTPQHSMEADRIGDSCTIWYDPAKPKYAQAYHGSDKTLKIILIIGIVMVILGVVLPFVGLTLSFT